MNRTDPTGLETGQVGYDSAMMLLEARRNSPYSKHDAEIMVSVYAAAISCAFGCEYVPQAIRRVLQIASERPEAPKTVSSTTASRVENAAERIGPLAERRGLGGAEASKTGGVRFFDKNGNSIRVEPGNPNANFASGRQPYVKETFGGTVRDAGGNPVMPSREFPNPASNPASHIPLETYLKRQAL